MVYVINNQGEVEFAGDYKGAYNYFKDNPMMSIRNSCTVSLWKEGEQLTKEDAPIWTERNCNFLKEPK